jgi:hypothetical protein
MSLRTSALIFSLTFIGCHLIAMEKTQVLNQVLKRKRSSSSEEEHPKRPRIEVQMEDAMDLDAEQEKKSADPHEPTHIKTVLINLQRRMDEIDAVCGPRHDEFTDFNFQDFEKLFHCVPEDLGLQGTLEHLLQLRNFFRSACEDLPIEDLEGELNECITGFSNKSLEGAVALDRLKAINTRYLQRVKEIFMEEMAEDLNQIDEKMKQVLSTLYDLFKTEYIRRKDEDFVAGDWYEDVYAWLKQHKNELPEWNIAEIEARFQQFHELCCKLRIERKEIETQMKELKKLISTIDPYSSMGRAVLSSLRVNWPWIADFKRERATGFVDNPLDILLKAHNVLELRDKNPVKASLLIWDMIFWLMHKQEDVDKWTDQVGHFAARVCEEYQKHRTFDCVSIKQSDTRIAKRVLTSRGYNLDMAEKSTGFSFVADGSTADSDFFALLLYYDYGTTKQEIKYSRGSKGFLEKLFDIHLSYDISPLEILKALHQQGLHDIMLQLMLFIYKEAPLLELANHIPWVYFPALIDKETEDSINRDLIILHLLLLKVEAAERDSRSPFNELLMSEHFSTAEKKSIDTVFEYFASALIHGLHGDLKRTAKNFKTFIKSPAAALLREKMKSGLRRLAKLPSTKLAIGKLYRISKNLFLAIQDGGESPSTLTRCTLDQGTLKVERKIRAHSAELFVRGNRLYSFSSNGAMTVKAIVIQGADIRYPLLWRSEPFSRISFEGGFVGAAIKGYVIDPQTPVAEKRIVVQCAGAVVVFDEDRGTLIKELISKDHCVQNIAVNNQYIATIANYSFDGCSSDIEIWDCKQLTLVRKFTIKGTIEWLGFSDHGTLWIANSRPSATLLEYNIKQDDLRTMLALAHLNFKFCIRHVAKFGKDVLMLSGQPEATPSMGSVTRMLITDLTGKVIKEFHFEGADLPKYLDIDGDELTVICEKGNVFKLNKRLLTEPQSEEEAANQLALLIDSHDEINLQSHRTFAELPGDIVSAPLHRSQPHHGDIREPRK